MHVCFLASEAVPFVKVGGLADVAGALPAALRTLGHRVTLLLPFYRGIDPAARSLARRLARVPVGLGPETLEVEVFEGRLGSGVEAILLGQSRLFDRERIYGDDPDEPLRFAFFCRAALSVLAERGEPVDVLHLHDWQAALAAYLRVRHHGASPALRDTRSILTLHNVAFQGLIRPDQLPAAGVAGSDFHPGAAEFYGQGNLLKLGMLFADRVTTVSTSYAAEILTPEGGFGLDGVLRSLPAPLLAIRNGIDTDQWNPATDPRLPHPFGPDAPEGRFGCRMALQQRLGLPARPEVLLAAAVARLTPQKGLDLVAAAAPRILSDDVQLVILGDGPEETRAPLAALAEAAPHQVRVISGFDEGLARLAYAAADLFLVPSRFEPCGLTQMIAMRYGAVPVARATGGLADTVIDLDAELSTGSGFVFHEATPDAFAAAFLRARAARSDRARWQAMVARLMQIDVSWDVPARRYDALYRLVTGQGE